MLSGTAANHKVGLFQLITGSSADHAFQSVLKIVRSSAGRCALGAPRTAQSKGIGGCVLVLRGC
jgi:hypothetical protein